MNQKKNEFITASTVFSSDTTNEKPMAEKISTEIMHPEVYYG